ncbi:hypothetical protein M2189_002777 [Bradyrhizobium japonicum]|uniref:hypothetical protein n=1 Tax=Bradyrhizobium japonicum TaxID=375 RepID=UPI002166E1D8|nr:hypothetical protein [Bradyrhizobium japonicum]MCS3498265.1 hypothetical protein [Bradyrhizobium japonicum]MCS3959574.1 hypothetical protein [Bradyrhizobium japonicum]MCS4001328.1 hypothetical protein [Bradyrhizobium japonicum]
MADRTEWAAIAVLTGLSGVNVPVASAVMTAAMPQRFTVIDFRALWSLGIERRGYYSVTFYLGYLEACRGIASDAAVDLRTLDRALWKHSDASQRVGG